MFKEKRYKRAIEFYTAGIAINSNLDAVLYSNRAQCYIERKEYELALKDCDECLRLDPNFIRGYSRKAIIYSRMERSLENIEKGIETLETALATITKVQGY